MPQNMSPNIGEIDADERVLSFPLQHRVHHRRALLTARNQVSGRPLLASSPPPLELLIAA